MPVYCPTVHRRFPFCLGSATRCKNQTVPVRLYHQSAFELIAFTRERADPTVLAYEMEFFETSCPSMHVCKFNLHEFHVAGAKSNEIDPPCTITCDKLWNSSEGRWYFSQAYRGRIWPLDSK